MLHFSICLTETYEVKTGNRYRNRKQRSEIRFKEGFLAPLPKWRFRRYATTGLMNPLPRNWNSCEVASNHPFRGNGAKNRN